MSTHNTQYTLIGLCILFFTNIYASCDTAGLQCQCLVSTTAPAFVYDPLNTEDNTNIDGSITVNCTANATANTPISLSASYAISISAGSSSRPTDRVMSNGNAALHYNLFTSPSYTNIWGDGTGVTQKITNGCTSLTRTTQASCNSTNIIYAKMPSQQSDAVPGIYTDHLIVTISY